MITLETGRLLLRPLATGDIDTLVAMHQDAEVARYLGGAWAPSKTAAWLHRTLKTYDLLDAGHLGIIHKTDDQLVGRCGLTPFYVAAGDPVTRCYHGTEARPDRVPTTLTFELGWALARQAWGHGYATEAAAAIRDHTFDERREERIISLIDDDNRASIAVATRLGFVGRGPALFVSKLYPQPLPATLYALERHEWAEAARRRRDSPLNWPTR